MSWFRRKSTSLRRWRDASAPTDGIRFRRGFGATLLVSALIGGCSDAQMDAGAKRVFRPQRTAQQNMVIAVSHDDADVRRSALADVARSKQISADWAVKGFIAVALLESDPQGRCVAIRALGRTGDPRAVETVLRVLNHADQPPSEVRPPDDLCRWEAMSVLADAARAGSIPEAQRGKAQQTLTSGLAKDVDRHVRDAAARGLAAFSNESAVTTLISGLEDADFAVIHRCEDSLVTLTGVTHHCDAAAWQNWFAANRASLFATAGQVPESRRPPYSNRWEKTAYESRQAWNWAFPANRER